MGAAGTGRACVPRCLLGERDVQQLQPKEIRLPRPRPWHTVLRVAPTTCLTKPNDRPIAQKRHASQ
eukprot:13835316-Alexandrium_andersonii.AAC.1